MRPINRYGLREMPGASQVDYEKLAFLLDWPVDKGGLGRYQHFKNLMAMWFPKVAPNDWLDLMLHSLCDKDGFPGDRQWTCWWGGSNSGKTFTSVLYAVIWWLCAPDVSSVILATTTGKALRRRAWPEVQNAYAQVRGFGNFVDSRTTWQCTKGDDKHAIFGIAVEDGAVHKAVDNIKGIHTRRQLVVVDEGQGTPEAVFEACTNLFSYPQEFQMLVMGNPWSRFDQLGKFGEPKEGYASVHPGIDEWETRAQLNGKNGRLIRFDAERSPNVVAGKIVCKHLIDSVKLKAAKDGLTEGSPRYWAEIRGYLPPEGLVKTVLTESEISRMGATGRFVFTGKSWWRVAGHDPAFGGGDRPVIWFAKVGEVDGNYMAMQFEECVILKTNAMSTIPVNFQLAQQCIRECEARGVKPHQLAVDSTGGGRVYCDILDREWKGSTGRVLREEFGGRASDNSVSVEDWREGSDAYSNRATEMWFHLRELVMSGQCRGIDAATCVELTARQYDEKSRFVALEKKELMKVRIGRSPDLADAAVLCAAAARRSGLSIQAVGSSVAMTQEVTAQAKAADDVYATADYSDSYAEEQVDDLAYDPVEQVI